MYTLADINPMQYSEFQEIVESLILKIKDSGVSFQVICPILRSGAIPATIIANKLKIQVMLPIHVKCNEANQNMEQILPFQLPIDNRLGDSPNILIVEANTITGKTAAKSYEIVKKAFPKSKIYYATVGRVFRNPEVKLEMYEKYFWGTFTDELFEATPDESKELCIRPKITIYPWETPEFELADING